MDLSLTREARPRPVRALDGPGRSREVRALTAVVSRPVAGRSEQAVAVLDGARDVDDRAVRAAGVRAQPVERAAGVDPVALHQDALGPLDRGAAAERALQAADLVAERGDVTVAAHRDLDRTLDGLRRLLARVGRDAALGRPGDE